jgi:hypothetical protein
MKYKAVMTMQSVAAYLTQLPFLGLLIALFINDEIADNVIVGVEIYCIVMCVICLLLAFINILFAFLNLTKDVELPYKTTMLVKIAMIPYYIINFFIWAIFVIGTLNPFFIVLLPLIVTFSIVTTYFIMISTGSQNIAALLKQFFAEKRLSCLIYAIFHFIFCADVIAAIMVYCNNRPLNRGNCIEI